MLVVKAAKHLARRGYDHVQQHGKPEFNFEISNDQAVILTTLLVTVICAIVAFTYTALGSSIILTLTAVEAHPNTTAYNPVATEDSDSKESLLKDSKDEEDVAPPPYEERPVQRITSSLRATISHLRREDGLIRFPFRGFMTAFWYCLIVSIAGDFLGATLAPILGLDVSSVDDDMFEITASSAMVIGQELAMLLAANMAVVATHAQISSAETNNAYGTGFKRVMRASWKVALPTLFPTFLIAIATCYTNFVMEGYFKAAFALYKHKSTDMPQVPGCALASILLLSFIAFLSGMALLRIQVSSFPRQDKTVVPINFGFGIIPESSEVKTLSFCQALRSYKCADLKAIGKMAVKLFVVSTLVHAFFGVIIYYQVISLAMTAWRF